MSEKFMQWFRLYSEIVDDEKLRLLAFEDRWHYVAILCCKSKGILDNSNPVMVRRMLAVKMGLDVLELDEVCRRLAEAGLLDTESLQPICDGVIAEATRPPANEWRALRQDVFLRDDFTCVYCGRRGVRLECDHVIPVARGGSHNPENLATSCLDCNRSKRDKTVVEWRANHG